MERPDFARIRESLSGFQLSTASELLSAYAGRYSELKDWLAHAEINRDRNLRLQYLAGMQLNSSAGTGTYAEMLNFRKFPEDLFHASPTRLQNLRQLMDFPASSAR